MSLIVFFLKISDRFVISRCYFPFWNIRMSTFEWLLIITVIGKSHNNHCSVRVMELWLISLLILIECFCVSLTLVCSLRTCHMRLTRNHMFIREIWGKFTSLNFLKFWNLKISKFHKSELGKFIPNFPLKHVITSTNFS